MVQCGRKSTFFSFKKLGSHNGPYIYYTRDKETTGVKHVQLGPPDAGCATEASISTRRVFECTQPTFWYSVGFKYIPCKTRVASEPQKGFILSTMWNQKIKKNVYKTWLFMDKINLLTIALFLYINPSAVNVIAIGRQIIISILRGFLLFVIGKQITLRSELVKYICYRTTK